MADHNATAAPPPEPLQPESSQPESSRPGLPDSSSTPQLLPDGSTWPPVTPDPPPPPGYVDPWSGVEGETAAAEGPQQAL